MLPVFRRKKEWLKWLLLLVIIALGFTTVLLFVDTPTGLTGGVGTQEVARVAGEPITAAQFGRYYRQLVDLYRQAYNLQQNDPEAIKRLGVGQSALNQLISQYAAYQAAEEMGLSVAPEEVVDRITEMFQENGRFIGKERYQEILRSNNLTPREFEDSVRRSLMAEKLRMVLTDGINPTPGEVREEYLQAVQQARIKYVLIDPAEVRKEAVSEQELKDYYDQNPDLFRRPEKRKIKYVRVYVPPTEVQASPELIAEEMKELPAGEQVHAKHILIRADEDGDAARERAEELLQQIRSGASFERLAEENSDDPGSAAKGGDLGFFGRGQMVPEFEEAAFNLQPGDVSDLVRTQFGFHIIKVIAKTEGDPESLRPVAEYKARLVAAEEKSRELAQSLSDEIQAGSTLEKVAQEHSLEVRESEYIEKGGTFSRTGLGMAFTETVFSLEEGDLTGPHETIGRQVLARVEDVQPSVLPEFNQIRTEVAETYEAEVGRNRAEELAFELHRQAREGKSFEELAREQGLEVTETDFFSRGGTIPDENLRYYPPVQEQAFALPEGGISTPIRSDEKYLVFEVAEKTAIDEEAFSREEPQIKAQLSQQKRTQFYNAYIDNFVDELRRKEEIQINQDLVDQIVG